jgi:hypothetical protein
VEDFGTTDGPVYRCLLEGDAVIQDGLGLRGAGRREVGLCGLPLTGRDRDGAPDQALLRWR